MAAGAAADSPRRHAARRKRVQWVPSSARLGRTGVSVPMCALEISGCLQDREDLRSYAPLDSRGLSLAGLTRSQPPSTTNHCLRESIRSFSISKQSHRGASSLPNLRSPDCSRRTHRKRCWKIPRPPVPAHSRVRRRDSPPLDSAKASSAPNFPLSRCLLRRISIPPCPAHG